MRKVLVTVVLEIDTEEYYMPSDGKVSLSLHDDLKLLTDDVPGIKVKRLKVHSEEYS